MPAVSNPEWWRRRRVLWPALAALLPLTAAVVAFLRAQSSRIMVYNDTGGRLTNLTVSACRQSRTFRNVDDRESVRLTLDDTGGDGEITLVANGVAVWHGLYIEPRGGWRVLLHLRRDGEVESTTTTSWWQSLAGTSAEPAE